MSKCSRGHVFGFFSHAQYYYGWFLYSHKSVQVAVLKEPVFEGEALFFSLPPFFEIKIHISALQKE